MQALGAYAFLSLFKGKKYFLKHVPEGLSLLKEDIEEAEHDYPELYKLIINIWRQWQMSKLKCQIKKENIKMTKWSEKWEQLQHAYYCFKH